MRRINPFYDPYGRREERTWYDSAQICLNGHVVNSRIKAHPEHSSEFCVTCGQPTIAKCTACQQEIRGYCHIPNVSGHGYHRPAFCSKCGAPFPWTQAGLDAARELSQFIGELSPEDQAMLDQNLDDLVKDTPRTAAAAVKFKSIVAKVGKEAASGFRDILVDVVSDTAKKLIWP